MNKIRNNKAFTLIELIVVVGIIGILVGIASPRFTGYTEKARVAKHASNAKVLENSVEVFNIRNERFPRQFDVPYTAEEVKSFSENIRDISGEKVNLDPDGEYYDLDYLAINDSISIPNDEKANYILQNPKGKVLYLENLTEKGLSRVISIENASQLAKIGKSDNYPLDGRYVQTRNIDLSEYNSWEPIGDSIAPFTGKFDGGGYAIKNLNINKPEESNVGLFGHINNAILKNIEVNKVNVKGGSFTGGLVGLSTNSFITNSKTSGKVFGKDRVGGLIGRQRTLAVVRNSYSEALVKGSSRNVGGLVGSQQENSLIVNSYATGDVEGESIYVGGVIGGFDNSTVKNSYATGKVTGTGNSGGLVGGITTGRISNSAWANDVGSDKNIHGDGYPKSKIDKIISTLF